jgi:membrane-bound lytic murein transglycosylase D
MFAALIVLALALGALLPLAPARAAENPVPRPPELERDVQFWIRVYTQIDTNSGYLHDQYNLGIVYDTLHFAPNTTPSERQRQVDGERERIAQALRRIADAGGGPLSAEDQRIRDLWGPDVTASRLRAAVDDIRFQLGQADRFRAGLVRSGAWETHIAETLANLGLPAELAVLPHVESSFNPAAYSKVGAAGLWQFMRSTGRRYMRIDGAVDDRLDPFRSTEAAAQLLAYNYRVLGTWPLALTAYNHGTAGMLRAKESMGTEDIAKIVRGYSSRTFGFASRNFYVSFLAALDIDRDPAKYFGSLEKEREAHFRELQMPAYVSISSLARAMKIDTDRLHALNPALLPPVWSGLQRVPKSYRLRLPLESEQWTAQLLAQRLAPTEMFTGQRGPQRYRIAKGDTLQSVAEQQGVPVDTLARVNHLRAGARLTPGHTLTLPEPSAEPATAVLAAAAPPPPPPVPAPVAPASAQVAATVAPPSPGGAVPVEVAEQESKEDAAATRVAARHPTITIEILSAAEQEAISPALGPASDNEQSADPTDYSVSREDTIRVATDETLGHYADWAGVSINRVRDLNHLSARSPVRVGEKLHLEFRRVNRETFEARRHEYHRTLQANYFAAHRIVGTEVYIARSGDSLWTLTQRSGQLPQWLLQQYNPDLDFADLRAGTQIVMPRVEEVTGGG